MPTYSLYVYAQGSFTNSIPDENSPFATATQGNVAGTSPWSLNTAGTLDAIEIQVQDNDTTLGESDTSQILAAPATIGGVTYPAGTPIYAHYTLTDTGSGEAVTALTFGPAPDGIDLGGGALNYGAMDAVVSTVPLQPNQTYIFDTAETSLGNAQDASNYVACFTSGTMIATPEGEVAVETLQAGDEVLNADGLSCIVQAVLRSPVSKARMEANEALRPVCISAGALGRGLPMRDLLVSRQHRMVVESKIAARICGSSRAFVAATHLQSMSGVSLASAMDTDYVHIICEDHEVLLSEGAPSESFYPGKMALAAMGSDARAEFDTLFPGFDPASLNCAVPILPGKAQKQLVARHVKNKKPLLEGFLG